MIPRERDDARWAGLENQRCAERKNVRRGLPRPENRPFLVEMFWVARTGCLWRFFAGAVPELEERLPAVAALGAAADLGARAGVVGRSP